MPMLSTLTPTTTRVHDGDDDDDGSGGGGDEGHDDDDDNEDDVWRLLDAGLPRRPRLHGLGIAQGDASRRGGGLRSRSTS